MDIRKYSKAEIVAKVIKPNACETDTEKLITLRKIFIFVIISSVHIISSNHIWIKKWKLA